MVRTVTNKPCSGAVKNGSPCREKATRQLDVAILTHNGRQCSHDDQHNTPWVCDKCYRCPMRCAQRDSQPHKKCAHGPIPRCARRLAAFHLGEFEFNFTDSKQSEESDITAGGDVGSDPSSRRLPARGCEAAASCAQPVVTPLNRRHGVAASGRKRGRSGCVSSLVHTRPAQRARTCGAGQGVEISIGTVASERRAEPAGALTRTPIDDAGLALLEDAVLGEESGVLDFSGEKDVGLFSWADSTLLHPLLDCVSNEAAIPDVDGLGPSGLADEDLSALLDQYVPTWSQEPLSDPSLLDIFDMDLLDGAAA